MARRISLGGAWQIIGYDRDLPIFGPLPATLPGNALNAMQEMGIVKEIEKGFNNLHARWVSLLRWEYARQFQLPEEPFEGRSERFTLLLRDLSSDCEVIINGDTYFCKKDNEEVDITPSIRREGINTLRLSFAPVSQAQFALFPHLPSAGLSEISLCMSAFLRISAFSPAVSRTQGKIFCTVETEGSFDGRANFRYRVTREDEMIYSTSISEHIFPGKQTFTHELFVDGDGPKTWQPGNKNNIFYDTYLTVERGGTRCDSEQRKVGIRDAEAETLPNKLGALPYALKINAQPFPIRGVWLHTGYLKQGSKEDWKNRLLALQESHVKLLVLKEIGQESFYEACDEMGLCVWQQLPLSLEGENLHRTILRIRAHASHVLWSCEKTLAPNGAPADERNAAIFRIASQIRKLDPGKPLLPTSPSGPLEETDLTLLNRGLAHDVQGPALPNALFWKTFCQDDALLRSKVACPSLLPVPLLEEFSNGEDVLRPDAENALHRFRGLTPAYQEALFSLCGEGSFAELSPVSRYLQAIFLYQAALQIRIRDNECAGIVIDSGNTPFPAFQSNALTDVKGYPQPALGALKAIWQPLSAGASSPNGFLIEEDGSLQADIYLFHDRPDGRVVVVDAELFDIGGELLGEAVYTCKNIQRVQRLGVFKATTKQAAVILRLTAKRGESNVFRHEFLFIRPVSTAPYALLREIDSTHVVVEEDGELVLSNKSNTTAIGVSVTAPCGSYASPGFVTLLPFEKRKITLTGQAVLPSLCRVEGLNLS